MSSSENNSINGYKPEDSYAVEEHLENLTGTPTNTSQPLPEPPNGGLWAWLQVVAALLANFNSWGIINAFGVYQDYYQKSLLKDKSPFQISWILALSASLTFFGTNFLGGLVDMGYIKYMGLVGCLLQFAALMLLSWSKNYTEVILTQGLFVGFNSAILFLISISAVAPYFSTRRPTAIGIGACGSSLGGTIYSVMARKLNEELSFGWSTRIIAFVQLATAAVGFMCIKRILPPTKRKAFFAYEIFREPASMAYAVGNIFGFLSLYSVYVYIESYAISQSKHTVSAYLYMTAITNAGSIFGRVLPAFLATKIGPFNVLLVADVLSLIVTFCWISAKNKGGIIAVTVIFGFVSGPLMALPGSIVSALCKDFNRLGIRLSFNFTFMSFGIVLGPAIAGIIERKYGWFWLKMYASLSWILCLAFHTLARYLLAGRKILTKV